MDHNDIPSRSQSYSKESAASSLHPQQITLETFYRLLSCYEATVAQVHRSKIILKLQRKPIKKTKGNPSSAVITKTDLSTPEEAYICEQTDEFLELDRWRYKHLPKLVIERKAHQAKDGGRETGGARLLKEELVGVMDWKMKHGVFRPALMGMVKGIPDMTVTRSTSTAFARLPDADPISAPTEAFPRCSLNALTEPLRGVGPATASLILSIGTAFGDAKNQVPFYSDDVYLWLVLNDLPEFANQKQKLSSHRKPNGELIAKYNVNEYRDLWDAVQQLRARLQAQVTGQGLVSLFDIEKVAYVIRNITISGFAAREIEPASRGSVNVSSSNEEPKRAIPSTKRMQSAELEKLNVPRRESKRLKTQDKISKR